MHRFFIPKPYKQEMQITGRDAHHIMDVLRMGTGDQFQVVADDGISFVPPRLRLCTLACPCTSPSHLNAFELSRCKRSKVKR